MARVREDLQEVHFWNTDNELIASAPDGELTVQCDFKEVEYPDGTKITLPGMIRYSIDTRLVDTLSNVRECLKFSTGRYRGTMILTGAAPESPNIYGSMSWSGVGELRGFDVERVLDLR
jgi:hypothetical protein